MLTLAKFGNASKNVCQSIFYLITDISSARFVAIAAAASTTTHSTLAAVATIAAAIVRRGAAGDVAAVHRAALWHAIGSNPPIITHAAPVDALAKNARRTQAPRSERGTCLAIRVFVWLVVFPIHRVRWVS